MKLKIMYELIEKGTGKLKKASKTFSSFVSDVADEGLKAFVTAYTSLMDAGKHKAMKIVTSELA